MKKLPNSGRILVAVFAVPAILTSHLSAAFIELVGAKVLAAARANRESRL